MSVKYDFKAVSQRTSPFNYETDNTLCSHRLNDYYCIPVRFLMLLANFCNGAPISIFAMEIGAHFAIQLNLTRSTKRGVPMLKDKIIRRVGNIASFPSYDSYKSHLFDDELRNKNADRSTRQQIMNQENIVKGNSFLSTRFLALR